MEILPSIPPPFPPFGGGFFCPSALFQKRQMKKRPIRGGNRAASPVLNRTSVSTPDSMAAGTPAFKKTIRAAKN
jgi:hypothetical protein